MQKVININQIEKFIKRKNWTNEYMDFMMCKGSGYTRHKRSGKTKFTIEDLILLADIFEKPIERFFNEKYIPKEVRRTYK